MRFLTVVMLIGVISGAEYGQVPQAADACDILAHLGEWNGKMVEARAIVAPGDFWLSGGDCKETAGIGAPTFRSLIALTDPDDRRFALHRVPFKRDVASWNMLVSSLYRADGEHKQVRVTAVGLLEVRPSLLQALADHKLNPSWDIPGFGVQGLAPAQILIKEVRDIAIEPRVSDKK